MVSERVLPELEEFLLCETPADWLAAAVQNMHLILIDHANCEKKAAAAALTMIHRYAQHTTLLHKMSRLAREELRHFEQVITLMKKRGVRYAALSSSRYASGLHQHISRHEPHKLIDSLIVGAFIEARSCERFAALVPHVDEVLAKFYSGLLKSEKRHFQDYLHLAYQYAEDEGVVSQRVRFFAQCESELIQSADVELRFHSGIYQQSA